MDKKKEIAKFFSGVAAMQVIIHFAFAVSDILPLRILGVTYTESLNTFAVIFWPLALAFLVYYAWVKKETSNTQRTDFAHT